MRAPTLVLFAAVIAGTISAEIPVSYLPSESFETRLGGKVSASIAIDSFRENTGCKLRTPSGQEYDLKNESPEGVTLIESNILSCGVQLEVLAKEFNGEWELEVSEFAFGIQSERKILKFTLDIEEKVNAVPNGEAVAAVGTNFHLRLEQPVDTDVKCHVEGPHADAARVEQDTREGENCAFIIRNVQESDKGTWDIVYQQDISYRATVNLRIESNTATDVSSLTLTRDESVDQTLGPENAVYCTLADSNGFTVYEGFGQCHLVIDRVLLEHEGVWKIKSTLPGHLLTNSHEIQVIVKEADSKPSVTATVELVQPSVILTCSVSTPHEVKACKFRDPAGNILIATPGIGEDRYSFYGKGQSYSNGIYTHECGIQISSVESSDLGLWRCAIDTNQESYFGFLTVLTASAMANNAVASNVKSVPTLVADRQTIDIREGEGVTMNCRIQTPIRYCYFRARNGTIFSVGPQTSSSSYSYSGAGFDAGECGITFRTLYASDAGGWSCHVGFPDATKSEQRAPITLNITQYFTVTQNKESEVRVMIVARLYEERPLEYCRFVRIDGLGFTEHNTPMDYKTVNDLEHGVCRLRRRYPSALDHHPWTVVARIRGQSEEIVGVTQHTLEEGTSPNPHPHPQETEDSKDDGNSFFYIYHGHNNATILMVVFLVLIPLMIATCCISRRNRQWTSKKTAHVRDSFRSYFGRDSMEPNHESGRYPQAVIVDKKEPLP